MSDGFWRFSLRTWRVAGVQEACLALQERCGADVNLLLFCGWLGREGCALDQRSLRRAIQCVGGWQSEVIVPMRQARRGLKRQRAGSAAAALAPVFRERFTALELALEQAEQALLSELAAPWFPVRAPAPPSEAIAANLDRYFVLLGQPGGPHEAAHLECISRACAGFERA